MMERTDRGGQATGLLSGFLQLARMRTASPYLAGRVLDFGCGDGLLARFVSPENYIGADPDGLAIAAARKQFPLHRFLAPGSMLPEHAEFDTIALLAVLEHLERREATLRDLARRLAPGGRIVITTPARQTRCLHSLGARLGLLSREAEREHGDLIGRGELMLLAAKSGLSVEIFRRLLCGLNQLYVLHRLP